MDRTRDLILKRIRSHPAGAVVIPKDFLDLASRAAVDQAFTRLVQTGVLQRVGRGLYAVTRVNPTLGLAVPPDPDDIADAIARRTNSTIALTDAAAANRLGLSTQVPAQAVYDTDGRSRRVTIGGRVYQLRHRAKVFDRHSPIDLAVQAIQYAQANGLGDKAVALLRRTMTPKDRRKVLRRAQYATAATAELARRLVSDSRGQ
jgi:hypothetical protein